MLGEDSIKWNGDPKRRRSEICKRKHCSNLNHIYNYFQSIYTRIYLLGLCRGKIYLDKSSPFLFDYLLNSILNVNSFIRVQFSNPLSTNSLHWAYWAWIQSYLGPRIQNALTNSIYKCNYNKCIMLKHIVPYAIAIIINVITIIIIKFHILTKIKREENKLYYIELVHALHWLVISNIYKTKFGYCSLRLQLSLKKSTRL